MKSAPDETLISVLNRAERIAKKHRVKINRGSLIMDLESLPDLDLERLLSFPDSDFAHDVFGIRRHMDRKQWPGKLTGCFEPRCGYVKASDSP